ncbi:hypothetical protein ES705_36272 [subsurface metagenome]
MVQQVTGQQLLDIGWTRGEVQQHYPGLFAFNGGAVPTSLGPPPGTNGFPGDIEVTHMNGYPPASTGIIPLGLNGYQTGPTHADVVPGQLGSVDGMPVSGPGVPEPPRQMVAKQWSVAVRSETYGTFRLFYFKLLDGRIMMYNPSVKGWKIWRPKKPIVLYRGKITLSQAVRTQRMLDKLWKTVAKKTKALKMA